MSLVDPTQAASFDQSGVYKLDVSEVLTNVLLAQTDFLSYIGIGGNPATQTKHQWVEDLLAGTTVTASATAAAALISGAYTTLVVSASHASRITAGTLLRDQASGMYEVIQVTALTGVSATVTRKYGSTVSGFHKTSAVWDIVGNARPQGMSGPKDESQTRAFAYNFTQIFSKGVQITGTAQAIEHYGISREDDYQLMMRMKEIERELDRVLLMGARAPNDVSGSTYSTMGGILHFASVINTANNVTTAETLTPSVINTSAKKIFNLGGTPDFIVMGATQKQKVSAFDQEFRRSTMDTTRAGYTIDEFVTDLGVNLRVIMDRWMPADSFVIGDSSRIKVLPLRGRQFLLERLAKTGDAENWQIVGEYTAEFRNAGQVLAWHGNLKP